jgi:phosphate transport system substrate-binding protein
MTETSADGSTTRRRLLAAVGAAGVGLAGCTQSGAGGGGDGLSGTIDIAGSSTVFRVAMAMAERFGSGHSGVDINRQSTGSGGGFANHVCAGRTDFNNASRPIRAEEAEDCSGNGVTPVELAVATDALTVVVNNGTDRVDCMTTDELARLWSAEDPPTTWGDVNADWPDRELELYGPTDASGTDDSLIEAILGEEGPGHRQDYSATGQDRTITQGVEGSEGAIGYLGFAYYSQNTDRVKAVGIDDGDGCVEPSPETARTGEYTPLSRPLFTYPKRESLSEEHVAEFARFWLENATGEAIIADEVGHVPLSDDAQSEVRIHTPRRGMTLAVSAEGHTRTTHGPTVCG